MVLIITAGNDRLFGFLLGSTAAGASVYYYILEEYKISNEMLTEDIYVCTCGLPSRAANTLSLSAPFVSQHESFRSRRNTGQSTNLRVGMGANVRAILQALQAATQRIYAHVSEIENKMALLERKK